MPKNYRLMIRCEKGTWLRFRRYAASHRDYEKALNSLLDLALKEGVKIMEG